MNYLVERLKLKTRTTVITEIRVKLTSDAKTCASFFQMKLRTCYGVNTVRSGIASGFRNVNVAKLRVPLC